MFLYSGWRLQGFHQVRTMIYPPRIYAFADKKNTKELQITVFKHGGKNLMNLILITDISI